MKFVLFLSLFIGMLLTGYFLNSRPTYDRSTLRERVVVINGALDKDKSFDGKKHHFTMSVSVQIVSADLFVFNDQITKISEIFYEEILKSKADLKKDAIKKLIQEHLVKSKVRHQELILNITAK